MVAENPVVIFSRSTCCICHCIKTLFVTPMVYELNEIEKALSQLRPNTTVPAVFISGEFEGGATEIINPHQRFPGDKAGAL